VAEKKCLGCGACLAVCTYDAIEMRKGKQGRKAIVNPVICKGDGLCNAVCPTGAIVLKHFTDQELESQIDALVEEESRGQGAEDSRATRPLEPSNP
jgi:heterodisulfide reductase subunit A